MSFNGNKEIVRNCIECKEDFYPRAHNQTICNKEHYRVCNKCGDEFFVDIKTIKTPKNTCAPGRQKCFNDPNYKPVAVKTKEQKACAECGDLFTPVRANLPYCPKDHTRKCKVCGTEFPVRRDKLNKETPTCSYACGAKYSHRDMEGNKAKRVANSLKRWGVENPNQLEEVKEKIREGHKRSNAPIFGSEAYQKKIKDLYGVENISQINIKNKEEYFNIEEYFKTLSDTPDLLELSEYFNVTPYRLKIRLDEKGLKYKSESNKVSVHEKRFIEFLESNFPEGLNYETNNRKLIAPKEVDFYFPDHKLAVEISPTITHNSFMSVYEGEPKDKNYHIEKYHACERQGIELITIFDWMPWGKTLEMIKHKLSGNSVTIGANKCHVETFTKSESNLSKDTKFFIDANHILGFPSTRGTQYYTVLKDKKSGDIIAAAGWGEISSRSYGSNKKDSSSKGIVELTRLVFKSGYSVPGGASRLMKDFERNYKSISGSELKKIVTSSDCDLGTGKIYERLGFTLIEKPVAGLNFVSLEHSQPSSPGAAWRIKSNSLVWQGADRLLRNLPGYTPVGLVCPHLLEDSSGNSGGTSTESTPIEVKREHPNGECLPSNQDIVRAYGFFDVYDCGYKKWQKVY